jgi:succinate dehydrogenase / fumarate reductase, cytochrome b subunit
VSGFFGSTVGKKVVMAATGLVLFGFVIVHMLGNLTVYLGREAMNEYAHFLHSFLHGGGIWVFRLVLLGAAGLHIWAMWELTKINMAARPQGYKVQTWRASTYASRAMRWSGVLVLAFIVFHLLHLTLGVNALHPHFVAGDAWGNVTLGFKVAWISIFYLVANLALGMHLFHGASSMLQTLGLNHARYNALRNGVSTGIALVVVAGNLSFPVSVLAGLVG